jgi:hypothetical protein
LPSLIAFRQSVEAAIPADALKASISLRRVCAAFMVRQTNGQTPIRQWARACVRVLTTVGIIPSIMKLTWRERLRVLVDGPPKLDMKAVSLKAGLGATFVRDLLEKGRTPSVENFVSVCEALGVSPLTLIYGDDNPHITVPIVGIVSAGEGWTHIPDARHDPVEFALSGDDLVGIEVRGDSMSPVYRDGDRLLCSRHFGRHVDNLIGLDCAVLTTDGKGYVKILKRGSRPGRYNLKSYNPYVEDIENAQIEWAAPVKWIRRKA